MSENYHQPPRKRAPGGGRKSLSGDIRTPSIEVTLPPEYIAAASALGNGNISAGVRAALEPYLKTAAPRRELQVWRERASGQHYLIAWQGMLSAAFGPLALEDAQAIVAGAQPEPAMWDGDLVDQVDDAWWRGEFEQVGGDDAP